MNAHAPTGLTPSAVHHGDLIRAIGADPDGFVGTAADVARTAGRDPTVNRAASRDLGQLEEQGFITRAGEGAETTWSLTVGGWNAKRALDVGEGRGLSPPPEGAQVDAVGHAPWPEGYATHLKVVNGQTTVLHSQLRRSPLNPRKDFDSNKAVAKREATRVDLIKRGWLIQALLIRPIANEPGAFWIVDGEGRERAIDEAIRDGDLPEDFPIQVQVKLLSDHDHIRTAAATALLRSDLNDLEEAQVFADLIARGETPQTLAEDMNRTDRYIQERIRVLNRASSDAKAAYLAGDSDWTTLRDSVKVPRHELALAKNPRLALLIVEIEVKARREDVDNETPMAIAAPPPGGVFADAEELGLLVRKPTPDNRLGVLLLPPAMEWLEEQGGDSCEDPARWNAFVKDATAAALGSIGAMALAEGQFGTTFLNAEPAPAPVRSPQNAHLALFIFEAMLALDDDDQDRTGTLAIAANLKWPDGWEDWFGYSEASGALFLRPIALTWLRSIPDQDGQQDARLAAFRSNAGYPHDPARKPWCSDALNVQDAEPDLEQSAEASPPTVRPGLAGDDFSSMVREANAPDDEPSEHTPATPMADGYAVGEATAAATAEPRSAAAPAQNPDELDGATALALVEIAFLVQEEPVTARGGAIAGARVGAYHLDKTGTATKLVLGGYVSMIQAPTGMGYLAVPTQKANDWIAERFPAGLSDDQVADLQALALVPRKDGERFVTPWLNPEPEQPRAAPAPQAETPKPPASTPAPDPVMLAFRTAFDRLWAAGSAVEAAMEGRPFPPGTGDTFSELFDVLVAAQPFLSKE